MSGIARSIGTGALALLLGLGAVAQASPLGTPVANRVPTGKGHSARGLFDDMVEPFQGKKDKDKNKAEAKDESGKPAHKHLTAEEWREAYIAKHGHALQPVTHPGH